MRTSLEPSPRRRCAVVGAVAVLALAGLAGALRAAPQETPRAEPPAASTPAAGEVFFESLDVRVVNVDVYVTDRDGRPVGGLTAADFEISEDGRPQRVTNFLAVDDGRQVAPAPAPAPAQAAPEPQPEPQPRPAPAPLPADQRLSVIVYLDNLHLRPFDRNRVTREVQRFLYDRVTADDRVMVVTFERSLHVRQPFTGNLEAVGRALKEVEELTGFAVQKSTERDRVIRRVEDSATAGEAMAFIDSYADSEYDDLQRSIDGLKELIASLGGLPGRKALLYVSDGLPMTAAEDLYLLADNQFGGEGIGGQLRSARYSARSRFRELTAHANANRVTFYTLGAAGLSSRTSISAESAGSAAGGSLLEADVTREMSLIEPLQMMAEDTGGQAVFNTNNIAGALERMGQDFRSYYSLGYTPAHHGDGRYHEIEVKVRRSGLEVRHRAGYRDKTVESRLAEGALAALLHGVGVNPLGVELRLLPPQRRGDGRYLVPFEVRVPIGRVTLIPRAGSHEGRLQVVVAAADPDGGTSPPEPERIPVSIPDADLEQARQQAFVYAAQLLMREGMHQVAVGLRDELGGETSFVSETLRVGR